MDYNGIRFFSNLPLDNGLQARAFFFKDVRSFNCQFNSRFVFFSNLSIYDLLVIMNYLVYEAKI